MALGEVEGMVDDTDEKLMWIVGNGLVVIKVV